MRYLNIYYILAILVGIGLWQLNASFNQEVVLFYGFAENKETEINFNYPVAVGDIYVSPGQAVKKGDKLLDMYRIKAKETLVEEPFKIAELRAKEHVWKSDKEGSLKLLEAKHQLQIADIEADIKELKAELKFQKSLYQDLETVNQKTANYSPISNKITTLQQEKQLLKATYQQQVINLQNELKIGRSPYREEIRRLEAQQNFSEENKSIEIPLLAPADGIVGNIYCKEAEHIPSFKTLVSFYEPNPSLVEGYLHEDLILHVNLQDSFLIRSTKDATTQCYGVVTGLGSRIVEIPARLQKIADMKTYGREILVSIPKNNSFLQKEKVILEFVHPPQGLKNPSTRKPLVDLKAKKTLQQ